MQPNFRLAVNGAGWRAPIMFYILVEIIGESGSRKNTWGLAAGGEKMDRKQLKFGWLERMLVLTAIGIVVAVTAPLWVHRVFPQLRSGPLVAPKPDFAEGSNAVYTAKFQQWPIPNTEFGSISIGAGNSYVLKPRGNHWVGNGPAAILPALEHDFVLDVKFRVVEGDPTIEMQLSGSGDSYESVTVYLSHLGKQVSYHLDKGRVKGTGAPGGHEITSESIVERAFVSPTVAAADWDKGGKITLKRDGDKMDFFLNDEFLQEFPASSYAYTTLYVAAAQKSTVEITGAEVRTRP
jgi:hypothetical protein